MSTRLNKSSIDIGVIHAPPYSDRCFFMPNASNPGLCMPGFGIEVAQLICQIISVQCDFHLENHTNWGSLINGSWDGLLGAVKSEVYDMTVPAFRYDEQRMADFRFTPPVFHLKNIFVTRRSSMSDFDLTKVFVFKPQTWGLILATSCVVATLVVLSGIYKSGQHRTIYFNGTFFGVSNLFSGQSVPDNLIVGDSARIIVGFWAIGVLLLVGHFSGNLLAMLLETRSDPPFHDRYSLISCLEKGRCRLIAPTTSSSLFSVVFGSNLSLLNTWQSSLRSALKGDIGQVIVVPQNDMVDYISMNIDKFNVWYEQELDLLVAGDRTCEVESIQDESITASSMIPKDGKYDCLETELETAITTAREQGYLDLVMTKYIGNFGNCHDAKFQETPLPLKPFLGIVFLVAVGCGVGLISCVAEILVFNSWSFVRDMPFSLDNILRYFRTTEI